MITRRFALSLISIFLFCSCASQNNVSDVQPRLVIPASSLINKQTRDQVSVAVEPYAYSGEGLDYHEAGIFPLLVTLTNNSGGGVVFEPDSISLETGYGDQYLTYRSEEAIELVVNSQALKKAAKGAAAGAVVGSVTGAIVGITIAAVFGVDPAESVRVGAKTGFVGGGAGGGGVAVEKMKAMVRDEINNNSLRPSVVRPGMTSTGWLFFPERGNYQRIHITVSREDGTASETFILPVSQYYQGRRPAN